MTNLGRSWVGLSVVVAAGLLTPAGTAQAQFGLNINTPGVSVGVGSGYYAPYTPSYYAPPVVVAPPPVVVAPAPVVVAPRPYPGYGYGYGRGYYGGYRGYPYGGRPYGPPYGRPYGPYRY